MTKATVEATERVRDALRAWKGRRPALLREIRMNNPRTDITMRWLQAFNDRQDRDPHFYKVVELGRALGVDVTIKVDA